MIQVKNNPSKKKKKNKISAGPVPGHSTPACSVSLRKQVCPQRAACLPWVHWPDCPVGNLWSCDSFSAKFTQKVTFLEVWRSLEFSDGVEPSWLSSAEAQWMSSLGLLPRTGLGVPDPQFGGIDCFTAVKRRGQCSWGILFISRVRNTSHALTVLGRQNSPIVR